MTSRRVPEKPATIRARKPDRSPRSGSAWPVFRRGLAEALRVLEDEEFLILAARGLGYFVQFAAQGAGGMRAEAISNTFITRGVPLSDAACRDLQDLGWHPPTYTPSADTAPPSEGSPNFYVELSPPVAHARLAALAVRTLRTIYGIRHPEELTYKSFSWEGTAIRLPMLTIPREVAASSRSNADESPTSEKVPTATPRSPEDVLFMRPDRRPIATEVVEADLRGRVTTCEEALEDAVWQLARFYSMVGRPREAMACVTRLLARTEDVEKRAGGFLALGQLLEQQDRHAEAEAMYAHGLEIPVAPAEVAYFLHNNRGYCLNRLGRHAEAETHTRTALAIDPARHNAHKNLGLALAGQGRLGEAAHCLLEADRRCPEDARARRHLAELLAEYPEVLVADPALVAACRERGIRPGPIGSA